ncbi:MAG: calcium/sodium antiporter [Firmicutes bacterium]|nr:calcium/sodium antiporter [Bacillota bacterium]
MEYLILIIGFLLLIKGADYFVEGASSIARIFNVPIILIGLTIVAFGTSAPEGAVSISAALQGSHEIAVGNIIGSSIFNILLVIGISSIIRPISIHRKTILKEFPFLLLTCLVLFVLSHDITLQGFTKNMISKADGMILLALFSIFLYYIVEVALLSREESKEEFKEEISDMKLSKSIIFLLFGLTGIIIGGDLVIDSSSQIAINLGMGETLVGLTIVAFGTSLPELVTSIVAAIKGENDIAVGNAIGSNVFNILLILGITSIINPLPVKEKVFFDMIYLLGATLATYLFVTTGKKANRFEGILMTLIYIFYMTYIIIRN